ncbi:MAG: hypothetical protein P1V35_06595 [Planctomycetota bacterium]|nr:hypothetical protein [Planctomycetota bacterium]
MKRVIVAGIVALFLLSGCVNKELARLKRENAIKRAYLADLGEQLSRLDEELVRQQAVLEVSRERMDEAYRVNRMSREDRDRNKLTMAENSAAAANLRSLIAAKQIEARRLKGIPEINEKQHRRNQAIAKEISDLRNQMNVLNTSIKRNAERRAAQYGATK